MENLCPWYGQPSDRGDEEQNRTDKAMPIHLTLYSNEVYRVWANP